MERNGFEMGKISYFTFFTCLYKSFFVNLFSCKKSDFTEINQF